MRSYTLAIASLALDAPPKWTDNTLSQHTVNGVVSARRGIARRISFPALLTLRIARELQETLGLPLAFALTFAHALTREPNTPEVHVGYALLRIDVGALRRELEARLADALESAPTPRRGRPAQRRSRT